MVFDVFLALCLFFIGLPLGVFLGVLIFQSLRGIFSVENISQKKNNFKLFFTAEKITDHPFILTFLLFAISFIIYIAVTLK